MPGDITHRTVAQLVAGRQTPYAISITNGDAVCLERADDESWSIIWQLMTKLAMLSDCPVT